MTEKIVVGILIFDGVELLDFAGPYEVFSATRNSKEGESRAPFAVKLLSVTSDPVTVTGGIRVLPDCTLAECPQLDILLIPGGLGIRTLIDDTSLTDWISATARITPLICSVCTGAMLLGRAGLLHGKTATTHWASLDWMERELPGTVVERTQRVVDNGEIITSAGISAGIDMALEIVARLLGLEAALQTANEMEYRWGRDDHRGNNSAASSVIIT